MRRKLSAVTPRRVGIRPKNLRIRYQNNFCLQLELYRSSMRTTILSRIRGVCLRFPGEKMDVEIAYGVPLQMKKGIKQKFSQSH